MEWWRFRSKLVKAPGGHYWIRKQYNYHWSTWRFSVINFPTDPVCQEVKLEDGVILTSLASLKMQEKT